MDNTRDMSRNCECNFGFYSIAPSLSCTNSCPTNCDLCENETGVCTKCYDSDKMENNGVECICKSDYYDNGDNTC